MRQTQASCDEAFASVVMWQPESISECLALGVLLMSVFSKTRAQIPSGRFIVQGLFICSLTDRSGSFIQSTNTEHLIYARTGETDEYRTNLDTQIVQGLRGSQQYLPANNAWRLCRELRAPKEALTLAVSRNMPEGAASRLAFTNGFIFKSFI